MKLSLHILSVQLPQFLWWACDVSVVQQIVEPDVIRISCSWCCSLTSILPLGWLWIIRHCSSRFEIWCWNGSIQLSLFTLPLLLHPTLDFSVAISKPINFLSNKNYYAPYRYLLSDSEVFVTVFYCWYSPAHGRQSFKQIPHLVPSLHLMRVRFLMSLTDQ